MEGLKKDRIVSCYILCFFLLAFLLMSSGHFYVSDELVSFLLTESIVTRGTIVIEEDAEKWAGTTARGINDKVYSVSGIGQSLAVVPFFIAGRMLAPVFSVSEGIATRFSVSLFSQFVTALTCAFLYLLLRRMKFPFQSSIATVFTYGFSTIAFPYSKYFFNVSLTSFLLLLSFFLLYSPDRTPDVKRILVSGISIGYSILVRPETPILIPLFIFYIYTSMASRRLRAILCFCVPAAIGILFALFYNYLRFGTIFYSGYEFPECFNLKGGLFSTPLLTGVYGLLLSSGKSLFLYSPVLVFSFVLLPAFIKRNRNEGLFIIFLFLLMLFFYSKWYNWHGGRCWGPRFLLPATVFLMLPVAQIFDNPLNSKKWLKVLALLFFISGLFIQLSAVLVSYNSYFDIIEEKGGVDLNYTFFTPFFSPIFWQVRVLVAMFRHRFQRLPDLWIFCIPAGFRIFLISLAGATFWFLLRKVYKSC